MIREIILKGAAVQYDLQYKKVKNINLRIKSDRTIHVSANRRVSLETIERFIISKEDFIINALEKYKNMTESTPPKQYFDE